MNTEYDKRASGVKISYHITRFLLVKACRSFYRNVYKISSVSEDMWYHWFTLKVHTHIIRKTPTFTFKPFTANLPSVQTYYFTVKAFGAQM